MDNLTHTLIGVVIAEGAARFVPTAKTRLPAATRRNVYLTLLVAGSNLPDADLLLSSFSGSKLDYLLHHRGHTHTVPGVIAAALVLLAGCFAWLRYRRVPTSTQDRGWLTAMALLGPLLHLAMDATNSYGVHPFWPLRNSWLYGDQFFIIEPLFWVSAAAVLAFVLRSLPARLLMLVILAGGVAIGLVTAMVPGVLVLLQALLGIALLMLARHMSARRTLTILLGVWLGFIGTFALAQGIARRQVQALAIAQFPTATVLDSVLTPMPVNPLCWEAILVQTDQQHYALRRLVLSLAPAWLPAARCPGRALDVPTTAPLMLVAARDSAAVHWHGEITLRRDELQNLTEQHCEAAAFMHFARAPWFVQTADGWVIGDLRFDREPELGFAELALGTNAAPCSGDPSPWGTPRADLLD